MNLGETMMSTTRRAAGIAAVIFTTALLTSVSAAGEREQPDRREREKREAREQREAEIRDSRHERHERSIREAEDDLDFAFRELEEQVDRLHDELNRLRSEQVDLEAEMESRRFEQREEGAADVHRRIMEVQHEIRRRELELDRHHRMLEQMAERRELMRMTDRLEYVSNWGEVAFDPTQAVMMATQAIVEIYVGGDEPERAAEILGQLLERVDELGSRTAIRFALKDVYMVMEDPERAANQMTLVIVENARGLRGGRGATLPAP